MLKFSQAELIYTCQTRAENGSPIELTLSRTVKAKEIKTFSRQYYAFGGAEQRSMRDSKNLVVAQAFTWDILQDGHRYELRYVNYNGRKYAVREDLVYFKQDLRRVLDIQELR